MTLIDGWKAAWRYHVVIAGAALTAISIGYVFSSTIQASLSPAHFALLTALVGAAIPVLRVLKQPDATAAVVAQAAIDAINKTTAPAAPASTSEKAP